MMWEPADFLVATPEVPVEVAGYVYRGLGLNAHDRLTWSLTHLGSGHQVCMLRGKVATVFPVAAEIAELIDWDFDDLTGWKNRDPELPSKLKSLCAAHPRVAMYGDHTKDGNREVAQQIAAART